MATVEEAVEEADRDGASLDGANQAGLGGMKLNVVRFKDGMYNNSASSGW